MKTKVAYVMPGEHTCQVHFKDGCLVTVITDGNGTIVAPSRCVRMPSGDAMEAPEGYVATAEKIGLAALAERATRMARVPHGRAMTGRGVTS